MPFPEQLRCPRCGSTQPSDSPVYEGCAACVEEGLRVNLVCDLTLDSPQVREALRNPARQSMWDFAPLLPVAEGDKVDLGEGWTPLVRLGATGRSIGLPRLWGKNESANPTWSHKDRLCAVATAAARHVGAVATTAVSTGNHGASVAAYAARAGLPSVIFTLDTAPEAMLAFINAYGGIVVTASSVAERNAFMRSAVAENGLYPISNYTTPSLGSIPFGIDGYKTIAYETWIQLGEEVPDWVVVPVGYGDCLSGVARGFADLVALGLAPRVPRLVAAEVFGAVGAALAGTALPRHGEPGSTSAFSIATTAATDQSLRAIRSTDGVAVTASEPEILEAQRMLGHGEGLFVEASSAAAVAVAARLAADRVIGPTDTVVALVTSTGLKDPLAAQVWQRPMLRATGEQEVRQLLAEALSPLS